MKIIASADIGDLGPTEGTAISYYWNPIYNLMGLLPWLLLAGAFVVFKENRKAQTLWIFLPVVAFKGIWAVIAALLSFGGAPSEALSVFGIIIDCLLAGFILNWLMAERIGNRNRFITWLLALVLFGVAYAVSLVNLGTGIMALQISIFIGFTVVIIMLSFPLAGLMCRKKFGPIRFSIWLAVWVLITTNALFMSIGVIQIIIQLSMSSIPFLMILLEVLMVSAIYAGILIIGLLPFEVLLFINPFWRKRFEAVFGIKTTVQGVALQAESESED